MPICKSLLLENSACAMYLKYNHRMGNLRAWVEPLTGQYFEGFSTGMKKFTGNILERGWRDRTGSCTTDGVLYEVLFVTGHLKALFDTTTTCLE